MIRMDGATPAIYQGKINGWMITWNPDDNRFYVERADHTPGATYAGNERGLQNARQFAKNHDARAKAKKEIVIRR